MSTSNLGFTVRSNFATAFADVLRGDLRLLLSGPARSAGRPMPDGAKPGPGGWNRIHLIVHDIDAEVARLRAAGAPFRNDTLERTRRQAGPATAPPATSSNSSNPPPSTQHDETPRVGVSCKSIRWFHRENCHITAIKVS